MREYQHVLFDLARRQVARYVAHTRPEAILLTGSVATGDADGYADLDILCYYRIIPPEPDFLAAREAWDRTTGVRTDRWNLSGIGEVVVVQGVEVQVGYFPYRFPMTASIYVRSISPVV